MTIVEEPATLYAGQQFSDYVLLGKDGKMIFKFSKAEQKAKNVLDGSSVLSAVVRAGRIKPSNRI